MEFAASAVIRVTAPLRSNCWLRLCSYDVFSALIVSVEPLGFLAGAMHFFFRLLPEDTLMARRVAKKLRGAVIFCSSAVFCGWQKFPSFSDAKILIVYDVIQQAKFHEFWKYTFAFALFGSKKSHEYRWISSRAFSTPFSKLTMEPPFRHILYQYTSDYPLIMQNIIRWRFRLWIRAIA